MTGDEDRNLCVFIYKMIFKLLYATVLYELNAAMTLHIFLKKSLIFFASSVVFNNIHFL